MRTLDEMQSFCRYLSLPAEAQYIDPRTSANRGEEKREWGALYIFRSEDILEEYLKSDLWVKEIPQRWGLKPELTILDPGPILCKETVTQPENSWVTE